MILLTCTDPTCRAVEPTGGLSPRALEQLPQAVGEHCHKCGRQHRFVGGSWVDANPGSAAVTTPHDGTGAAA